MLSGYSMWVNSTCSTVRAPSSSFERSSMCVSLSIQKR